MLGRHADSLFWMARYLERSENNARRIQAAFHYALSREDDGREEWKTILSESGSEVVFRDKYSQLTLTDAVNFLLRDRDNVNSIITLIYKARQNGRSVRANLTQEVWLSLNESWIACETALKRPVKIRDLPGVLEGIIKGSSLFRGALYGTMLHNDIFNFLRLGTYIERADNTLRIMNSKHHQLLSTARVIGGNEGQSQWEVMLRSLAAWRSFNWLRKGQLDPASVANFLIFDARMPRSINFCYTEIKSNLGDLSNYYCSNYVSYQMACELLETLNVPNVSNKKIKPSEFISTHIVKNNEVSRAISTDFNLCKS